MVLNHILAVIRWILITHLYFIVSIFPPFVKEALYRSLEAILMIEIEKTWHCANDSKQLLRLTEDRSIIVTISVCASTSRYFGYL